MKNRNICLAEHTMNKNLHQGNSCLVLYLSKSMGIMKIKKNHKHETTFPFGF